jgi:TonB family protein
MSSTVTIHKDESLSRDRRCRPREPVQQAVLVFFGENNWGKLIDLGESGMSFEFDQAPPLRQKINFKLETMGCTAAHLGRQHFNDSFGLAGEVVWTRQFERAAGVRFLDLPEGSRQQIQNLVSFETAASTASADEATSSDVLVSESEPTKSAARPTEAPSEGEGVNTLAEAGTTELWTPPVEDFDSEQIPKILEAPTLEAYEKLRIDEPSGNLDPLASKSRAVRIALIAVLGLLAILAAVAAATRIPVLRLRGTQGAERVPSLPAGQGRPAGPDSRSVGLTPQPFMVEVSDANNKKWLLWFDHNLPKSLPMSVAHTSVAPSSPSEPRKKATGREQSSLAEKHDGLQGNRYFKPQLSRPKTNPLATHSSADAAPVIPDLSAAPSLESTSGILTPAEVPAPIVKSVVTGGKVQLAHLLKSVPPAYPELARSLHLAGDVTLDALIAADGNVRDVKVVSGPVVLQQAAINAVREWKYEPAQLDGKPVPMQLRITVKFSSQ